MTSIEIQRNPTWKLEVLKHRSPILIAVIASTVIAAIVAQQAGQSAASLVTEVVNANDRLSAQEILQLSAIQVLPILPGRAAGEALSLFAGTPVGWLFIAFTAAIALTSEHRWGTWPSAVVRRGTSGALAVPVLLLVSAWIVAFLLAWATTSLFSAAWTGTVQASLPDALRIDPELRIGRDLLSLGVAALLVLVLVTTAAVVAAITRSATATALVTLLVHVAGLMIAGAFPSQLLSLLPANACVALLARLRPTPVGGSISQLSIESGDIPAFVLVAVPVITSVMLIWAALIVLRRSEVRK